MSIYTYIDINTFKLFGTERQYRNHGIVLGINIICFMFYTAKFLGPLLSLCVQFIYCASLFVVVCALCEDYNHIFVRARMCVCVYVCICVCALNFLCARASLFHVCDVRASRILPWCDNMCVQCVVCCYKNNSFAFFVVCVLSQDSNFVDKGNRGIYKNIH